MGRIVAIDYGKKLTGLAVTDTMQMIAGGLGAVPGDAAVDFLKNYVNTESVDVLVVGLPKQLNNKPSENMQYVEAFVKRLRKVIPQQIPIEFYDERFTSVMAHQAMIDGGLKKMQRRDKALVNEISATLILQGYLERKKINL